MVVRVASDQVCEKVGCFHSELSTPELGNIEVGRAYKVSTDAAGLHLRGEQSDHDRPCSLPSKIHLMADEPEDFERDNGIDWIFRCEFKIEILARSRIADNVLSCRRIRGASGLG